MLPVTLLCREMLDLTRTAVGGKLEFMPTPPGAWMGVHAGCSQKNVSIYITPDEMNKSLDDLSESVLLPASKVLADALKADDINYSYELACPKSYQAVSHHNDGLCMRAILRGLFRHPLTDFIEAPVLEAAPDAIPDVYELRIDVLYSHHPMDMHRAMSRVA